MAMSSELEGWECNQRHRNLVCQARVDCGKNYWNIEDGQSSKTHFKEI